MDLRPRMFTSLRAAWCIAAPPRFVRGMSRVARGGRPGATRGSRDVREGAGRLEGQLEAGDQALHAGDEGRPGSRDL